MVSILLFEGPLLLLCRAFASGRYRMVSILLFECPLLLLCRSFASGSYRMVSILLFEGPLVLLCRSVALGSYRTVAKKQSQFKQLSSPPSASRRFQSGYVGNVACRVPDAEGLKDVTYLKGFYQPVCLIFEIFSRKIRFQTVLTDTMEQDGIKDEWVLKCPSCPRESGGFQSAKLFLRHQLEFHLDHKCRCPECGARLQNQKKLENHLINEHGMSAPKEEVFPCPNHKVAKSFSSISALQKHNKDIHKGREVCDECYVAFANKAEHLDTCAKLHK